MNGICRTIFISAVTVGFAVLFAACENDSLTDPRDGKTYRTVVVGKQVWMAENLNYADSATTTSLKGNSWCYDGRADSCAKYGRLYAWKAAMNACPVGFHLPDTTEWNTLYEFIYRDRNLLENKVGTYLKASEKNRKPEVGVAPILDAYGFSAFFAGYRFSSGGFANANYNANFWTATKYGKDGAYYRALDYAVESLFVGGKSENSGFSVRCIKN